MAKALNHSDSDFSDDDLSPLDISFNKAADHLKKITSKLNNNQLLELYGYFKQGLEGECNVPRPGWMDGRGRRKWDAWKALGDMPKEKAKERYVELMHKFDPEYESLKKKESTGPKETWVAVSSMLRTPEPDLDLNELSILDAARENMGDLVTELLKNNPELKHERDDDGLTALHWAADRDATLSLTAAIKGGCPIDAVDDCGQTALHYAASCGHLKSTKILVEAGASLLKDEEDCTPKDLTTDNEIRKILEGAE